MTNKSDPDIQYIAGALRRLEYLADEFQRALVAMQNYQQIDDIIREITNELPHDIDRIYAILLVILDRLENKRNRDTDKFTSELRRGVVKARIRSLEKQRLQHQANLNWAEEQAAVYGAGMTTLEITNKIIFEREKISSIDEELKALRINETSDIIY